jgi:hypothetical protein
MMTSWMNFPYNASCSSLSFNQTRFQ